MESVITEENKSKTPLWTLFLVTLSVGVASGFLGMTLALLLHYIQHIAYGYSPLHIISNESFLEGVSASSPERRVTILIICGLIAGLGWAAVYQLGKPLVSIAEAIKTNKTMPMLSTTCHALLQIVTIALGSPLGREVAPREASAVFATWISTKAGLSIKETKIMLACGAGAGLAAVYNVPLGGAVFVLEVLLCTLNWSIVLPALTTSAIAVVVSWWGLGNEPLYHIPDLTISYSLVIWSIGAGPFFGMAAFWFIYVATIQRSKSQRNWMMIGSCLINFTIIGVLSIYFPQLLGNGKSPAQLEFSSHVGIGLSVTLLMLRSVIVWSSLRVGAQGGLLTPSLANGALLGAILGGVWNMIWPTSSFEAFALVGAAAFLGAAQKMPVTAIILIFELTRIDLSLLIPILFAVSGSVAMFHWCKNYFINDPD
ncbi:chloride channel protein [Legionella bononiensis]|uniref:Chloride channel protein n=1 Tax=Legionella bononiensis TaxID=2793102 RepID=A0ABS1WEI8_9GAMM|nr:chloride channel protein [Legionella bononiensis]MBL7479324.1 chloride channel protein [Legionella bononiensis]MBL7479356.1 chloride channel protein [Legionella bononiensis]MBL7527772.1 chloride channel protein [Legionella bononiensis]MBL7563547.1 chloride channel protein [Legionella bononiensis]